MFGLRLTHVNSFIQSNFKFGRIPVSKNLNYANTVRRWPNQNIATDVNDNIPVAH